MSVNNAQIDLFSSGYHEMVNLSAGGKSVTFKTICTYYVTYQLLCLGMLSHIHLPFAFLSSVNAS